MKFPRRKLGESGTLQVAAPILPHVYLCLKRHTNYKVYLNLKKCHYLIHSKISHTRTAWREGNVICKKNNGLQFEMVCTGKQGTVRRFLQLCSNSPFCTFCTDLMDEIQKNLNREIVWHFYFILLFNEVDHVRNYITGCPKHHMSFWQRRI